MRTESLFSILIILGLSILVFGAVMCKLFLPSPYPLTLPTEELPYFAQVAKSLVGGEGLSTRVIYPLSLSYYPKVNPHPELTQPPLTSIIFAAFFLMLGPTDFSVMLSLFIFYSATSVLVFIFGCALFDRKTALLGSLLFIMSPGVVESIARGNRSLIEGFLLLILLIVLFGYGRTRGLSSVAWAGVIVGLTTLTRYRDILIVFPVIYYLVCSCEGLKWRPVCSFLGGLLFVLLPWFLRNTVVVGSPFFSLADPITSDHLSLYSASADLSCPFTTLLWLLKSNFIFLGANFLSIGRNFVMFFVVASLFITLGDEKKDRLKYCFIAIALVLVLTRDPGKVERQYADFAKLMPFASLLAAAIFFGVFDRFKPQSKLIAMSYIVVFLLINAVPCAAVRIICANNAALELESNLKMYIKPDKAYLCRWPIGLAWNTDVTFVVSPDNYQAYLDILKEIPCIDGCLLQNDLNYEGPLWLQKQYKAAGEGIVLSELKLEKGVALDKEHFLLYGRSPGIGIKKGTRD